MNFHRAFCSVSDYLMCELTASMTKLGCTLCEGSKGNIIAWKPTEKVNQNFCFSSIHPVGVADHFTQRWRGEEIGEKNKKSQQMPPAPLSPSPVATLQLLLGRDTRELERISFSKMSKTPNKKKRKEERIFINFSCHF